MGHAAGIPGCRHDVQIIGCVVRDVLFGKKGIAFELDPAGVAPLDEVPVAVRLGPSSLSRLPARRPGGRGADPNPVAKPGAGLFGAPSRAVPTPAAGRPVESDQRRS
jgi:hypothetical protein